MKDQIFFSLVIWLYELFPISLGHVAGHKKGCESKVEEGRKPSDWCNRAVRVNFGLKYNFKTKLIVKAPL